MLSTAFDDAALTDERGDYPDPSASRDDDASSAAKAATPAFARFRSTR
jgi:hypothetical protein